MNQDLGLFWQLTLKTIEDLNIVSNEIVTLEMYIMQLTHLEKIEEKNIDEIISNNNIKTDIYAEKKVPSEDNNLKPSNLIKNQLKNVEQVKNLAKNESVNKSENFTNSIINSFSDLIDIAEKNKEMELKYDLERNVKLAKFENGKIDINFNENLNKNFIKTSISFYY